MFCFVFLLKSVLRKLSQNPGTVLVFDSVRKQHGWGLWLQLYMNYINALYSWNIIFCASYALWLFIILSIFHDSEKFHNIHKQWNNWTKRIFFSSRSLKRKTPSKKPANRNCAEPSFPSYFVSVWLFIRYVLCLALWIINIL